MASPPDPSLPLSPDFKLCGFLPLVLSVFHPQNPFPPDSCLPPNPAFSSLAPGVPGRSVQPGDSFSIGAVASCDYWDRNVSVSKPFRSCGEGIAEFRGQTPTFNGNCNKSRITFQGRCYSRRPQVLSNRIRSSISDPLERLIGTECWITGEGADIQFHTNGGFVLSPIVSVATQVRPEDGNSVDTSTACTLYNIGPEDPCFSSGIGEFKESRSEDGLGANCSRIAPARHQDESKSISSPNSWMDASSQRRTLSRKRKRMGYADNGAQILNYLQILRVRNGVRLKGHIVRIARRGAEVRAVVLLDLYLPSFLWSGRNYWKPSPVFTAVLSHLRTTGILIGKQLQAAKLLTLWRG